MTKILVIEDEPMVRTVILDILETEGFEVIGGENGRVGVELAIAHIPDLIICDVMMPEVDGYSVLATVRQHPEIATTPFIFLTAKASKADLRQGMELGADDYLTKPFTHDELLGAIHSRIKKQEILNQQSQAKLDNLRNQITLYLPHELRTPLNGIIAGTQFLMEDLENFELSEIREMLQDIHFSAKRLYRLVYNFLLYSDLELLARDPERAQQLRASIVDDPCAIVSQTTTDKVNEESINRFSDLHLNLQGVSVQIADTSLTKIVAELVDNACKFSQPGTPIQVSSYAQEKYWYLVVQDQGWGMVPEQVANIGAYHQFNRKDYEQQGAGLGLIIAKRLTELHHGSLSINSTPGAGTTVTIKLPEA
mgnify:CR=1 FL=1